MCLSVCGPGVWESKHFSHTSHKCHSIYLGALQSTPLVPQHRQGRPGWLQLLIQCCVCREPKSPQDTPGWYGGGGGGGWVGGREGGRGVEGGGGVGGWPGCRRGKAGLLMGLRREWDGLNYWPLSQGSQSRDSHWLTGEPKMTLAEVT